MNFKDEYNDLQKNIVPDAEFLDGLAQKMELQKRERSAKRSRKKPLAIFVSAAAVGAGAAAALIVVLNLPKPAPEPTHSISIAVNENKINYTTGVFADNDLFADDKPASEQLAQMLFDSETVLYKSDENRFETEDKVTAEQRNALASGISNSAETDSALGEKADHYMAVLQSGDVVKFRISGNILSVNGSFYRIP